MLRVKYSVDAIRRDIAEFPDEITELPLSILMDIGKERTLQGRRLTADEVRGIVLRHRIMEANGKTIS